MSNLPAFSALHRPLKPLRDAPVEKSILTNWQVEDDAEIHPCFDPATGVYTVATDGLYSLIVEVIPIGSANIEHAARRRVQVDYAVRIQQPVACEADSDTSPEDFVDSEYLDVGSINLGEVVHMRAGTKISCWRMPVCAGNECVRMRLDLLQRKRKNPPEPELSKKELKKIKKKKRKAELIAASIKLQDEAGKEPPPVVANENSDEDDSDEDWSDGFESDTSEDQLPHSKKGVTRLAKRLKTTRSSDQSV